MYRIGKEEIDAVARVIESKKLFKINKDLQETMHAEEEMKELFDVEYGTIMTSGHGALVSALIGMGVGPGDEVIVPAYTYIATAMVVVAVGAIPVLAEVDETLTLDPADFERKISSRTKAVIPVHIQGFPCKMDAIKEIADKHNVMILEDACQADGGRYHGKRLGAIGDAGALSFNFFKVISCGEGGALLTNNKKIYEGAFIYHDSSAVAFFGDQLSGNDTPVFCGNEYRTNEIASAILREQFKRMDGILDDLRKNKKIMMDALAPYFEFIPSNDIEGDCGTTLAIRFACEEQAKAFETSKSVVALKPVRPIDTGKHVYTNWAPVMERRGALHPALDPFKMEENKDCNMNYAMDMCPKTLDYLKRTVYIMVNPDDTAEELNQKIAAIKEAAN